MGRAPKKGNARGTLSQWDGRTNALADLRSLAHLGSPTSTRAAATFAWPRQMAWTGDSPHSGRSGGRNPLRPINPAKSPQLASLPSANPLPSLHPVPPTPALADLSACDPGLKVERAAGWDYTR